MTSYTDEKVPKVVLTAPERIFLQVSDQEWDSNKSFPGDCDGVSWWKESVLDVEVEYVRADLFAAVEADRTRLQAEVEALQWLPLEPCPTEAPCHFNNAEAQCWAYGYSSCLLTIEQYRQNIDSARAKKGDV